MKSNNVQDEIFRRKSQIVLRLVELNDGEYENYDSKRDKSSSKLLGASNKHKLCDHQLDGEDGIKNDSKSKTNGSENDEDENDSCCCDCCCGCIKKLCRRRRNKKKMKREKKKSIQNSKSKL